MSTLIDGQPTKPTPTERPASPRLMSLDALRGFDMFWIIGADALVATLNQMSQSAPTSFLAHQLTHAAWEGFRFYDLIFPLFIFIVGVSLAFSLNKTLQQAGRGAAVKRLVRRSLLLFVAGLIYSNGFSLAWPDIRLMGVLNRIALVYFCVGLLFCFLKPRTLVAVGVALLTGYWALMTFVPVRNIQLTKENLATLAAQAGETDTAAIFREPGNPSRNPRGPTWTAAAEMFHATTERVTGKYERGLNLSDHLDFQYLPGRKYDNFFDPEGYLSTLPALVTGLLGVFAGLLLANRAVTDQRKILLLLSFGIGGIALGWWWHLQFPVVKKIWTSSFVLVAGGYSAILLAVFYWIVDVLRCQRWCQPFVWMGMNSITIYLASKLIDWFSESAWDLIGESAHTWLEQNIAQGFGQFLTTLTSLLLAFGLVYWLYRRRIFLRF